MSPLLDFCSFWLLLLIDWIFHLNHWWNSNQFLWFFFLFFLKSPNIDLVLTGALPLTWNQAAAVLAISSFQINKWKFVETVKVSLSNLFHFCPSHKRLKNFIKKILHAIIVSFQLGFVVRCRPNQHNQTNSSHEMTSNANISSSSSLRHVQLISLQNNPSYSAICHLGDVH